MQILSSCSSWVQGCQGLTTTLAMLPHLKKEVFEALESSAKIIDTAVTPLEASSTPAC